MPKNCFWLIFLGLLLPVYGFTAHLKGGYIQYEYIGPSVGIPNSSQYQITVFQYLDCSSLGGQVDSSIYIGVFYPVKNERVTVIIPLSSTKIIQKQNYPCIDNPPNLCYRIDQYTTMMDLANNNTGHLLSVQRCCRISGIDNVLNSSNTGIAYSVLIKPNAGANNSFLRNSCPIFSQKDTALVCSRIGFTLPFEATDPDGDSLVYSFTNGLNTPTFEAKPFPPNFPPYPPLDYAGVFSAEFPLGALVSINRSTGIISGIAPNVSGEYVVAVLIEEYRDGLKIGEIRKEIHITVGSCTVPWAQLPERFINCSDFTMAFQNLSASSGINAYYWDFGITTRTDDISNLPTPSFTYTDTGVYRAKLVVNRGSACPDSTFTTVEVFPRFNADFDIAGVCTKLPYQFTDRTITSYGIVNNWRWAFGDPGILADSSKLQNPNYFYNQPGNYTISLIATNSKGCIDTTSKTLKVLDKPTIDLDFRDTLVCEGENIQLIARGIGNYSWTPTLNMQGANTSTPLVSPILNTTTFVVLYKKQGCLNTDSVRVEVVKDFRVDAGNDTTICRSDSISINPKSIGLTYSWSPIEGLDDANKKNPIARPTDSVSTYTVMARIGSCIATDELTIRTVLYPLVFAGIDTTICHGSQVLLQGATNAANFIWSPANLISDVRNLQAVASPGSVSQNIILMGQNPASGCPKPVSDTLRITVLPGPQVFAGNDLNAVVGQPIQLNGSTNGTRVEWTPAMGISDPQILNPVLTVTGTMADHLGEYISYTLTAKVNAGCTLSDDIVIRIFKTGTEIFVPSAFTPNGDGKNDIIRPIFAGIKQMEYFRVYNRYGQLVFETKIPGKGWDGRINGQLQQSDSFVYHCKAIDYLNKPIKRRGSFTLIR